MRVFVRHTKSGEIVSVAKANVLPEGLDHPYVDVGEEESVLEVVASSELEQLDAHEIAARFRVDPQRKQLTPQGAPPPAGRSRRRREDT